MYIVRAILILFICLIILISLKNTFSSRAKFYTTGFDFGFKLKEINLLWTLAKSSDLENPTALYWSIPSLDRCISTVLAKNPITDSKTSRESQNFLNKLYTYRTKVELEAKNNNTMKTTKSLKNNQQLRVVYPEYGLFTSKVLNVGRVLVISMPKQKNELIPTNIEWQNKKISVYFYRYNDAGYVFDTQVIKVGKFNIDDALFLQHSDTLVRVQKRQSIRVNTSIYAQIFVKEQQLLNKLTPERKTGLKCLIENISENGALIRVGGKGIPGLKLKLQFNIDEQVIVMYGIIKSVEYNKTIHQSRVHFECLEIDPIMKNLILTFVYELLPKNERIIYDAMEFASTGKDGSGITDTKSESTSQNDIQPEES